MKGKNKIHVEERLVCKCSINDGYYYYFNTVILSFGGAITAYP